MIDLTNIKEICLICGETDMRKGLASLISLAALVCGNDLEGKLILFCGRSKKQIKAIEVTSRSAWLYQKRLIKDCFRWPASDCGNDVKVTKEQLLDILDGLYPVTNIRGYGIPSEQVYC